MMPLDQALATYTRELRALAPRTLPLEQALGHVLAAAVESRVDLPLFTQSAVDGYAVRSADLAGASADRPVTLELAGEIAAGSSAQHELTAGRTFRIFTGGALPAGADASARQEIVERSGNRIVLRRALAAGADTRFRGEELKAGEVLAQPGQRLGSGLIAALAMAGVSAVPVHPRPRVALLVSGDEVASSGSELRAGEIHDANGPLVRAWLAERGYPLVWARQLRDDRAGLRAALAEALACADAVITTGGVSVGDHDHLPRAAADAGVRELYWKVAQKPGKPIWFGTGIAGQPVLSLPGNPAAVLIGLHLHVSSALRALEGSTQVEPSWRKARLARAVKRDEQRDQLLRVCMACGNDGSTTLTPLGRQDSHMLSNLGSADGMAWIRRGTGQLEAGDVVEWLALG